MAILEEETNVLKWKGDEIFLSNASNSKAQIEDDACSNATVCLHCQLMSFIYKILTVILYLTVMDDSDE